MTRQNYQVTAVPSRKRELVNTIVKNYLAFLAPGPLQFMSWRQNEADRVEYGLEMSEPRRKKFAQGFRQR